MSKIRKGFSLSLALITLLFTSMTIVATISLLTRKQDEVTGTSHYVQACIAQETGAFNTAACVGTFEGCKAGVGKDCNTLFEYVNDSSLSARVYAMTKNICDDGGNQACLFLINQCADDEDNCDISGNSNDIHNYLSSNFVGANTGGEYVFNKAAEYYNKGNKNFNTLKDFIEDTCDNEWIASKTLDSIACRIVGKEVASYTYNFDEPDRNLFIEEDVEFGTDFEGGLVKLLPPTTLNPNVRAWCWGNNIHGQIGDGTYTTPRLVPIKEADGHIFTSIVAGEFHTCGLKDNGEVWCWGLGDFGQLGRGSTLPSNRPVKVTNSGPGGIIFKQITAGSHHNCGLNEVGKAYCWGNNGNGRLGIGNNDPYKTVPTAVYGTSTFTQIAAGYAHTCAIYPNTQAACWGWNAQGQLGIGNGAVSETNRPSGLPHYHRFRNISLGHEHSCGIKIDKFSWPKDEYAACWGYNYFGQLGNNTYNKAGEPSKVYGQHFHTDSRAYIDVTAGSYHTCALRRNGDIRCWGKNGLGQLGTGSTAFRVRTPQAVQQGGQKFKAITAGSVWSTNINSRDGHTCGLTTDGKIYCWGKNNFGQLGRGSANVTANPTPMVISGTNIFHRLVDLIGGHTCGLKPVSRAYITTTKYNRVSQINESVLSISITQTTPGISDIRWIISSDEGYNWKYWDGNSWEDAITVADPSNPVELNTFDFEKSCTAQDLIDHLDEYSFGSDTHLDFAFDLQSESLTDLPSVDEIIVTYY